MSGGDPEALQTAQEGVSGAATDVDGVATDVRAAYGICAGALGNENVDAALERFVAAYGGELLACSLSAETLAQAAGANAELLDVVTGGG